MSNVERFYKLSEEELQAKKRVFYNIKELEEDMKQLNIDPTPLVYDDQFSIRRCSKSGIIIVEPVYQISESGYEFVEGEGRWELVFMTFKSCAEFVYMNLLNGMRGEFL